MLSQNQSLKQLQKMSPQQIMLMKLLQVPTAQLEDRIKEELELNPALEDPKTSADDDIYETKSVEDELRNDELEKEKSDEDASSSEDLSMEEYLSDDNLDTPDYKTQGDDYNDDDDNKTIPHAVTKSFHEHLEQQLGLLELDDHKFLVADYIIGSIDDDGYLRRPLDAMIDDLAFSQNVHTTLNELNDLLYEIQQFDPPGIAARNLQECLLIQLRKKEHPTPYVKLAIKIIENHFDEFTKKHYDKLCKEYDIDDELLKIVLEQITHLNPKPGSGYNENSKMDYYVIPDFIIINNDGELTLTLNSRNAPELKISNHFKEMIRDFEKSEKKDKQQRDAILFVKQKLDSAKWFIDAIKQRQHTMLSVMRTLMKIQYNYFLTGDESDLKPMILKDIAEPTQLDISTVSRVANSKYVQTEFGTLSLKSFFSESMSTDSGEEVSNKEIKKILTELIAIESKKKPWSDEYLMQELNKKGYNIARRTVAKYRDMLDIPVARLRKEL
jgi:RNA polymerase sigma-54 factor